ncbi:MAG: mechanosensitive ion channel family protein [Bacteroidota bacterium]
MKNNITRIVFFFCLSFPILSYSQTFDTVRITLDDPYNTVLTHLHYLQEATYRPDLSARTLFGVEDSSRAEKLAIQLKQILDGKGLYVQIRSIPQDSNYIGDTLSRESFYTLFPEELPEIYVEKIEGKWYYSPESIAAVPALHKEVYPFGADLVLNLLPKGAHRKILGLALWQYAGILIIIVAALILYLIIARLLNPLVKRITEFRFFSSSIIDSTVIRRIARYLSLLIILRFIRIALPPLQLPIAASKLVIVGLNVFTTIIIVSIALTILSVFIKYGARYTKKTESKLDEQLIPLLNRAIQFIIISVGVLQVLRLSGVNITALVAGISIGGLAIALAAQDTLKNLFGSLTIFLDKPFQIGDWINFSGVDVSVEEVGFRSTRVRTFANSLVYVPNGKLMDMVINNYGLRQYRRYSTKISLTYDTPPLLINKFIEGLKKIVMDHPATRKDYFEVHLNEMSAHSLDILFYIFFDVDTWTKELESKHEVLIATLELADTLGVRFAFPTTTLFVEEAPGSGSLTPNYTTNSDEVDQKLKAFFENRNKK